MVVAVVAIPVFGGGLHIADFTRRAFYLGVESVAKIKIGSGVKISFCIYRKENNNSSGPIYLRVEVNRGIDGEDSGIRFIYGSGYGPPEGIVASITVTTHASGSDVVAALIVVSGGFRSLPGLVFFARRKCRNKKDRQK